VEYTHAHTDDASCQLNRSFAQNTVFNEDRCFESVPGKAVIQRRRNFESCWLFVYGDMQL